MDRKKFESLMRKAKTKQETETTRSDYWWGFQQGLSRLYHGESFGTAEEHEKWVRCGEAEGDYGSELQKGYLDGYYYQEPSIIFKD